MLTASFELQVLLVVTIIMLILILVLYSQLKKSNKKLENTIQDKYKLDEKLVSEKKIKEVLINKVDNQKSFINELSLIKDRFSDILDKESFIATLDTEIENKNNSIELLRESYKTKKAIFDNLSQEVAIYDETIESAELGFYKPSFNFDHSEQYKNEITKVKSDQKQMLKDKTAVYCYTEWTIEGSKAKGKTFSNRSIKMTTRAFNNECDSAISSVKWNNATRIIERVKKAFSAINKLNETNKVVIDKQYLELKISELKLTHEYHEKKQQEKEEQAEIREQMREEARLEKELEDSIKEEDKYQSLLNKAQKQAQKATGEKLSNLEKQIAKLNSDLEEAIRRQLAWPVHDN